MRRRLRRPLASDLRLLALLWVLATGVAALALLLLLTGPASAMPLSAGDRLQLVVESGEEFSGKYQVDTGGRITLPYAGAVAVDGLEPEAAAALISDRLVGAGLFKRSFVRSSVLVLHWAPLDVRVSGAVFLPGAHRVNQPPTRDRAPERSEELPGASTPDRRLSDALRAAGGVTPYADVAHVAIRRQGRTRLYNLWGLILGETGEDPALQQGDEVLVPALPEAQAALARPSAITPPGIKIFVSNLIQPSMSNSAATASGGAMSLAYGTRFSQAVVAANCVGGSYSNASRSAVLVRTDRLAGSTRHWERPVETLIRDTGDSDNPLLLEGDAVSCYDSAMTSVAEVFRVLSNVLLPFTLFRAGR